ncbi:MAG: hypothetical protein NVS3B5_09390 [Sphingomicrobium sp.]
MEDYASLSVELRERRAPPHQVAAGVPAPWRQVRGAQLEGCMLLNGTAAVIGCAGARRVAFSWNGLPQYAARLIRAAIERIGHDCAVIGSRPSVPVEGMEEVLGQRVHWVDATKPITWRELGLDVPEVFIQSGWSFRAFSTLGREAKARGACIIGLSDANWRGDFRQVVLAPLAFRVQHKAHFDAMIVPGEQGSRLMRYFGMPGNCVLEGMYGADPTLFRGGGPLQARPKTFLFVGQFIARKDVLGLARAFLRFSELQPGWSLRLIGSGVQRDLIPLDARILVDDFVQPEALAACYRQARFFVLPSRSEAWGLVVHEAALCGCALILSDAVASASDLAESTNAVRFRAGDEGDLVRALFEASKRDAEWLGQAEIRSRAVAGQFGPDRFSQAVVDAITHVAASGYGARSVFEAERN